MRDNTYCYRYLTTGRCNMCANEFWKCKAKPNYPVPARDIDVVSTDLVEWLWAFSLIDHDIYVDYLYDTGQL